MKSNRLSLLGWILFATLGMGLPRTVAHAAPPAPGDTTKLEGTITEREGDRITLRLTASDRKQIVKLSSLTEVREKKSNPFRKGRKYAASQIVPGLTVEVEGRAEADGTFAAEKIRFSNDDFKMARTVDSRVTPVEDNARRMSGQIAELDAVSNAARGGARAAQDTADKAHQRITDIDQYETVQSVAVRFKVGSAQLSPEARRSLDELAGQAKTRSGFVIEVAGFASSEGGEALNRRLSRQRAQAVSEYLAEQHDIPLRRIMTPTGYGESHPAAPNSTRAGRQENRRVEVRILVSRGMATTAAQPAPPETPGRAATRPERER